MTGLWGTINEDANALCYVWLTFALIVISIVCFATASPSNSLIFVGIFFSCLAAFTAIAYIARMVIQRKLCLGCDAHCLCCRCCRYMLCLPPAPHRTSATRAIAISRRERQRVDAARNSAVPEGEHPDRADVYTVNVAEDGSTFLAPAERRTSSSRRRSRRETTPQSLQRELQRLRRDYEFLVRQNCVDDVIREDYDNMNMEEARVMSWIDNLVSPTPLELKTMKGRLKAIARNFRNARSRLHSTNQT